MRKDRLVWLISGLLLASAAAYWFAPWKLLTSKTVDDVVPAIAVVTASGTPVASGPGPVTQGPTGITLTQGTLIAHEHATTGTVQLIQLADGRRQLVLRDLSTSDGPDLRVWLTDQAVASGEEGWKVFDDGVYVELGRLKGNRGTQVYDVPDSADLSMLRSVSIWCKRFSVSFGAADLS